MQYVENLNTRRYCMSTRDGTEIYLWYFWFLDAIALCSRKWRRWHFGDSLVQWSQHPWKGCKKLQKREVVKERKTKSGQWWKWGFCVRGERWRRVKKGKTLVLYRVTWKLIFCYCFHILRTLYKLSAFLQIILFHVSTNIPLTVERLRKYTFLIWEWGGVTISIKFIPYLKKEEGERRKCESNEKLRITLGIIHNVIYFLSECMLAISRDHTERYFW